MSGGIAGPHRAPDVVVLPPDGAAARAAGLQLPGVPLAEAFVKSMALPNVDEPVLREVVRLQVKHGLNGARGKRVISCRRRDAGDRTLVLITAVVRQRGRVALPRPWLLFGAAARAGLVDRGKNSLLVYRDDAQLVAVSIEEGEIVFVHGFGADANLRQQLEVSAQAVYLRRRRRPLKIDRVIVCEGADQLREPAASLAGAEVISVFWLQLAVHIAGAAVPETDARVDPARWLPIPVHSRAIVAAPSAMLVVQEIPRIARSLLAGRPRRGFQRLVAAAVVAAAIPLLALQVMTSLAARRSAGLEDALQRLQPQVQTVQALRSRNAELTQLTTGTGAAIMAGRDWHRLMAALDTSRPDGLRLSSLEGARAERWSIAGRADDVRMVGEFVDRLSATGLVADVNLTLEEEPAGGTGFAVGFLMGPKERLDP